MKNFKRNEMCGNLREKDIDREVILMGWIQRARNLGSIIFVDLRDTTGFSQIVFDDTVSESMFKEAEKLRSEYVIAVKGKVRARSSVNEEIPTGKVEVLAGELSILNEAETPPIYIKDGDNVDEAMRLKYRYLDLRKPSMQNTLKLRAKVASVFRRTLEEERFIEIETPFLGKPTPEGARDYLVPSRLSEGKFYALPQSPQLFKQLLMVSGMDRYFQIVKCFRDEDLRANRQPEFTQVDLEMSFVDVDDVIELNEKVLKAIFKEIKGIDIEMPIQRMTYKESMDRFGVDKPDLRFGMELVNITEIVKDAEFKVFSSQAVEGSSVRAICVEGGESFSRKDIDKLEAFVKTYGAKGLAWIKITEEGVNSPIAKFLKEEEISAIVDKTSAKKGDLILIVADKDNVVFDSLGNLRNKIAKDNNLYSNDDYKLVWIVEFPLFEYDEEEERLVAKHHPFTHPMDEDIELLESQPEKVRAKAYDIVINGEEMGGGSIRISNSKLQERMFKALGFTQEEAMDKFGFLIEAFKYGTPPHGGLAYGFDRMIMTLAGIENIRDVIAFPKTQSATCLMTSAPTEVTEAQLEEIHMKIR